VEPIGVPSGWDAEMADLAERTTADGVPAGYRMTELGPLPESWRVAKVADIGNEFFSGGTPSSKVPEYWGGGIPWTTSASIASLRLDTGVREISALGLARSSAKVVPAGNLLIGTRVGVGKVAPPLQVRAGAAGRGG
jgi:type I restriction enzyme S subunit